MKPTGIRGSSTVTASVNVDRGLNDVRLAVLGILVGIGLTVGFGVPCSWWLRVGAGVFSFAVACFLIKWGYTQRRLMSFMHWLTEH